MSAGEPRRRVVVVGGGIAALECVLALHDADAEGLDVCLVAPDVFFTLPPLAVARPFARGSTGRLPLDRFMDEHGGRLHAATATRVDAAARAVLCDDGEREHYDVLVIAAGGRRRAAFGHALTFGLSEDRDALSDVLADLEQGHGRAIAFVVPEGATWTLPLYELALMTAEELRSMGREAVEIHLVTPEAAPLEAFGALAATGVAELLAAARIELHTSARADVPRTGTVELGRGSPLHVDRIVALPALVGPHLAGLPHDSDGFLPVDASGRLAGHLGVYAIGDATAGGIKQGGIASQQADLAATDIVAAPERGARPAAVLPPLLRGRLLTGHGDRFLQHGEPAGTATGGASRPAWWPATKVVAHHLGPYLERSALVELPIREEAS